MNTDRIYAEQLANEYAPKATSKVVALRKLDANAKRPAQILNLHLRSDFRTDCGHRHVPIHGCNWKQHHGNVCAWGCYRHCRINWDGGELSFLPEEIGKGKAEVRLRNYATCERN